MTLFGRTFEAQEIAALVGLLAVLVLWIGAWRGERNWSRWFRGWEADRKARREAELAAEQSNSRPPDAPRGPWG